MAKVTDKIESEEHIHNWYTFDTVEYRCKALYKGAPCIKIKVGAEELARREAEWENYYEVCRKTEAYEDFKKMQIAYKDQDLPEIRKIMTRVNTRMIETGSLDKRGEKIYDFPSAIESPRFPDPFSAKDFYILT